MENTFGKNIIPANDKQRIEELKRYQILDTPPENAFNNVARLATKIFKVPVSLISLVDAEQVFFKANIGMGNIRNTPRGVSLCSLSVLDPEVTVFENAPEEPCLLTNPNVAGNFGLRFYAGAPLTTANGFRIGTLCIIDKLPRKFTQADREMLEELAKIVMDEIELRLSAIEEVAKQHLLTEESEAANEELMASNEQLQETQKEVVDLNGELHKTNQEISEANNELLLLNAKLNSAQDNLLISNSKLAESEELKDMAIEQAQLGIWYIDAETRAFKPSKRLKEFFWFDESAEISFDDAMERVREDYKKSVALKIDYAIDSEKPYELEYPIIDPISGKTRWICATGKLNPERKGRNSYFSGTIRDITQQKEDDQRKSDFISMVSHELKTPLTSMGGYVQVLKLRSEKGGDTVATNVLDRALIQTRKMNAMIDGFLNMSRAETGKIPIDQRVFDMEDLASEAEKESFATVSSHKVIFAPVESTLIKADRHKIAQVLTNLINNAVKYSPAGSIINVACISYDGFAQVSVKDHGMGIAKEDQEKIFSRFYRVENDAMNTIAGFGIGLYLCNEIINGHGGKIWVESEVGEGSTFYFKLPLNT